MDWNAGIRAELDRLFGDELAERLLFRYQTIEPPVQDEHPAWGYRQVNGRPAHARLFFEYAAMLVRRPLAQGDG